MADNKVQGEGNREAAKQYNEATRDFVESGKVDDAARDAAQASDAEEARLKEAERQGKEHIHEEDPALKRDYSKPE